MVDRFGVLYDFRYSAAIQDRRADLDFVELIPDRFLTISDPNRLTNYWAELPTVFHCLNFSIGSAAPLSRKYLKQISRLARDFNPMWLSDHLAVTRVGKIDLGSLSPIRTTPRAMQKLADKISIIQDELQTQFLVENISFYFRLPGNEIPEADFLQMLVERTGCGILLDINNVVVNSKNHGFNATEYVSNFPLHAVREIHIAGHRRSGDLFIDSHADPVGQEVWDLLTYVASKLDRVNVILERDQELPPFEEVVKELAVARKCVSLGRAAKSLSPSQQQHSMG